jgi:hypothetical protein
MDRSTSRDLPRSGVWDACIGHLHEACKILPFVTNANGIGHGGRKASPALLRSHPLTPLSTRPAHSRWRCIFGARIASPVRGREPTAADPRGVVLALLGLLAWLAHAVVASLLSLLSLLSPQTPETPFLFTFSSFLLLPTHFSTHHDGTTTVALLRGGPGERQCAPPGLHGQCH